MATPISKISRKVLEDVTPENVIVLPVANKKDILIARAATAIDDGIDNLAEIDGFNSAAKITVMLLLEKAIELDTKNDEILCKRLDSLKRCFSEQEDAPFSREPGGNLSA